MTELRRIAFFGTPEFALPALQALVAAGREPALVVSQPARPAGRGRELQQPAVAEWAAARGLPLVQPARVREETFLARLAEIDADLAVVVAFGQIFPAALLALPRHGCVNVHASLLPRHRGAAPIQAAILAGDEETGVTTMLMDQGLDTGPMLRQAGTPLSGTETALGLAARLAHLGAALLLETLDAWEAGGIQPRPQQAEGATYAPRLDRGAGRLDWGRPAAELARRWRALVPWPGVHAVLRGEPLKVVAVEPLAEATSAGPGAFLGVRDAAAAVACGDRTVLLLTRVQRPGRRVVTGAELAHGERLAVGEPLG